MTTATRAVHGYVLNEGVRVFRSGEEIRFRKGVWSYNEATLRLAGQTPELGRFFNAVFEALSSGPSAVADMESIAADVGLNGEQLNGFCEVLENLKRQQFLRDVQEPNPARLVRALMGGNLSGFEEYVGSPRSALFFTDNDYAREAALALAREIKLPLDVLDSETLHGLAQLDLTSRTDAVGHAEGLARYEKLFLPYACVLGCMASPNMSLLRNLNRLLILAEKPLILGLIDGPFASLLSTLATQSGCFECFEQRMLTRLEDTQVYHQFVQATAAGPPGGAGWFAPSLHLLTAGVISEGYLYSTLSMLRLAGRIISVYQPLLEIQVQDLLRVPYCPACGFIAKSQMNEMYTSTNRLVSEMLSKIELEV